MLMVRQELLAVVLVEGAVVDCNDDCMLLVYIGQEQGFEGILPHLIYQGARIPSIIINTIGSIISVAISHSSSYKNLPRV